MENNLQHTPSNLEPLGPILLAISPLIQRVRGHLWLLAMGTIVDDDPVTPRPIITQDFHVERRGLDEQSSLLQDYHRLLSTIEDNSAIYESSLHGGLSIALTALLKVNGYKVVFVQPEIGNIPKIRVLKEGEKMNFLPQTYYAVWRFPLLDTIHRCMDVLWKSRK